MRVRRELTAEELEAFLESRQRWVILSSLGPDGYPHTVPMGFFRLDGDFYLPTRTPTQKTRNIEREPRVTLLLENGRGAPELVGVMLAGDAEVIADPARLLEIKHRRGDSEAREVAPGIAYIRVRPRRTLTWHRS